MNDAKYSIETALIFNIKLLFQRLVRKSTSNNAKRKGI